MVLTDNTFALLVLLALAVVIPGAIIVLSALCGRPRHRTTDMTPYECGSRLFESARHPFTVKFYLIAMLFILLDIEAVFLYPWAVELKNQVGTGGRGLRAGRDAGLHRDPRRRVRLRLGPRRARLGPLRWTPECRVPACTAAGTAPRPSSA